MSTGQVRIPPLELADCNDEQRAALAPWMLKDGSTYNMFRVYARHPELMQRWHAYGLYVMRESTLPPRQRELAIMRTAWLNNCDYEWGHHRNICHRIGVTDEDLARVTQGPDAEGWTPHEALVLRAVDEMKAKADLTDATFDGLSRTFDERQLLDLVHTVGAYNLMSISLNVMGVAMDDGVEGLERFRPAI